MDEQGWGSVLGRCCCESMGVYLLGALEPSHSAASSVDEVTTSPHNHGALSTHEETRTPSGILISPPDDTPDSSVLWRLVHDAPPEMLGHVLDLLPPEDRAMLSRVDRACHAAVGASGLQLAGSCRSKPFHVKDFTATVERLRWARTNGLPWDARTSFWYAST